MTTRNTRRIEADSPASRGLIVSLSKDIHTYDEMVQRAAEAALAVTFGRPAEWCSPTFRFEAGTTNILHIEQMVAPHEWSSECLKLAAGSTDRCNTFCELLSWGLIEQGLSGSFIELPCDCAELGLAMQGQVSATRKILAQQSVGVFV